jgi:hypothetical protein
MPPPGFLGRRGSVEQHTAKHETFTGKLAIKKH